MAISGLIGWILGLSDSSRTEASSLSHRVSRMNLKKITLKHSDFEFGWMEIYIGQSHVPALETSTNLGDFPGKLNVAAEPSVHLGATIGDEVSKEVVDSGHNDQ